MSVEFHWSSLIFVTRAMVDGLMGWIVFTELCDSWKIREIVRPSALRPDSSLAYNLGKVRLSGLHVVAIFWIK